MSINIKTVKKLSEPYHYLKDAPCIVCNNKVIDLGGRNKWIKIKNTDNNKVIYRKLYGSGNKPLNCNEIELDYDSVKYGLDVKYDIACSLKLYSSSFFGQIIGHCKHPDPKYRIPLLISILGLMTGIVSMLTTFFFN